MAKSLFLSPIIHPSLNVPPTGTMATRSLSRSLNSAIDNSFIGGIIEANEYALYALFPLGLMVSAEGTAEIERVEVVANGEVIHTHKKHMGAGRPERKRKYVLLSM